MFTTVQFTTFGFLSDLLQYTSHLHFSHLFFSCFSTDSLSFFLPRFLLLLLHSLSLPLRCFLRIVLTRLAL